MGSSLFPDYTLEKKPYLELKYWKIFKGVNKSTGENVSVFLFEKKALDKVSEREKQNILLCLRKEPETLIRGKNKHKNFLTIIKPLAEDNSSMGFITEYITYNLISWIKEYKPTKLEIKYIIYQLLSVVYFMHNDFHISHNNLNTENIFLTEKNFVKITGFMFTTNLIKDNNSSLSKNLVEAYCDLKYCVPELILNNEINNNSDNFIIGLISYYLLGEKNNNNDLLVLVDNTYDSYNNTYKNTNMEKKINNFSNDILVKDFLKGLLNTNPDKRKNLSLAQNSKFFIESEDNSRLVPLCLLSKMESAEIQNNYDLLKLLPNILDLYSIKEKEFLILPNLLYYLKIESLINPIVPAIFLISEKNNKDIIFKEKIWPTFKTLFNMKKFPAATLYFTLKKLSFLIKNLDETEFNKHCIPLICKALDCGVQKIQEVVLEELPNILNDIDKNEFKNNIYNRLVKIVMQSKNKKLKKKIMNFLMHLCDYFDSYFINNNFLDDIEKIIKSETTLITCKNAFILYEKIKSKVNDKSVRSKIIPSLLLMMCNGEISENLFNQGEKIIHSYIEKIKEKRKEQFVQDLENDSDSDKNSKSQKSNNNNKNIGSPISVSRSKSNLSGNISLFECNSSEDSKSFDLDEKNKTNKKEKIVKIKEEKNNKKISKENKDGNLFDNLLGDENEENYNKNDSSFDSTSFGKNKNKNNFNSLNKKEFLSSLKLKKVEKQKQLENKEQIKTSKFNENKKSPWEEIESDDENTDEIPKPIKIIEKKENNNYTKKESKKSDKKKKWDEDEDEDDDNADLILNYKTNESESDLSNKGNLIKIENKNINNEGKKLDELLLLNNENFEKETNDNNNPINSINNNNENKSKNEENNNEEHKKKGEKKKKKHKKKEKKDKENNDVKMNNKEEKEENEEKNKDNQKDKEKEVIEKEKNIKKEENVIEKQTSTTKIRMNERAKNIDLDNLLDDD